MKLSSDTIIAEDKLLRYLLVPQVRGDKSAFLARAGYRLDNAHRVKTRLSVFAIHILLVLR